MKKWSPFDVAGLCQLLGLANTYFSHNGHWHQQTFGTAMGALTSVTTSNLTMEATEPKAWDHLQPKLFLSYVDGCFCILQCFLEPLNGAD